MSDDRFRWLKIIGAVVAFALIFYVLWLGFSDCIESSPAKTAIGRSMDCT